MPTDKEIEVAARAIAFTEVDGWTLEELYGARRISLAQAKAALEAVEKVRGVEKTTKQ